MAYMKRARPGGLLAIDNVLWASDYPHVDSTWPHSQQVITEHFANVSEREKHKIVCANAAKLYGIAVHHAA